MSALDAFKITVPSRPDRKSVLAAAAQALFLDKDSIERSKQHPNQALGAVTALPVSLPCHPPEARLGARGMQDTRVATASTKGRETAREALDSARATSISTGPFMKMNIVSIPTTFFKTKKHFKLITASLDTFSFRFFKCYFFTISNPFTRIHSIF